LSDHTLCNYDKYHCHKNQDIIFKYFKNKISPFNDINGVRQKGTVILAIFLKYFKKAKNIRLNNSIATTELNSIVAIKLLTINSL
jgi:hypothetical protein